jgi:hypothetical protein
MIGRLGQRQLGSVDTYQLGTGFPSSEVSGSKGPRSHFDCRLGQGFLLHIRMVRRELGFGQPVCPKPEPITALGPQGDDWSTLTLSGAAMSQCSPSAP